MYTQNAPALRRWRSEREARDVDAGAGDGEFCSMEPAAEQRGFGLPVDEEDMVRPRAQRGERNALQDPRSRRNHKGVVAPVRRRIEMMDDRRKPCAEATLRPCRRQNVDEKVPGRMKQSRRTL